MTKTILMISFLISSLISFSQTTPSSLGTRYDTALIQQYSSSKFKLNNKTLTRKELRELLLSRPESAEAYKVYRKNRNVTTILWSTAGALYVGSIIALGYNPEVAIGLLAGSVATMLTTIPSDIKADRSIHKAVWLYNRTLITGEGLAVGSEH